VGALRYQENFTNVIAVVLRACYPNILNPVRSGIEVKD